MTLQVLVVVDVEHNRISRHSKLYGFDRRKTHESKLSAQYATIDNLPAIVNNYRHFPPNEDLV